MLLFAGMLLILVSLVFALSPADPRIKNWWKVDEPSGPIYDEIVNAAMDPAGSSVIEYGRNPLAPHSISAIGATGDDYLLTRGNTATNFSCAMGYSCCTLWWANITNVASGVWYGKADTGINLAIASTTQWWMKYTGATEDYHYINNWFNIPSIGMMGVCTNGTHYQFIRNGTIHQADTMVDYTTVPTVTAGQCLIGPCQNSEGVTGVIDDFAIFQKTTAGVGNVFTEAELLDLYQNWIFEGIAPLISDPICTSCILGTNKTSDTTPTINITCTTSDCQSVRISNNSAYDFATATSARDCAAGEGDTWVCTLPASDQIASQGITPLYFWANSTSGSYHLAYNATISITYTVGYNISFGSGISAIKWIVPFYTGTTAYNVSPVNETESVSLWVVGNNGTATGQVDLRLNSSYPSVVTECARNPIYADPIILNETWQAINSSVISGDIFSVWCRRNYTDIPIKKVINWQFNFTTI